MFLMFLAVSLASVGSDASVGAVASAGPPAVWEAGMALGQGLRFNNPYRLSRSLGSSAESLSITALYADALGRVSWSGGLGSRQGLQVSMDVSIAGISQWVLSPSYWLLFEGREAWDFTARVGIPIGFSPDTSFAAEGAAGLRWEVWSNLFVQAEVIGSVFVGAAIPERGFTLYPLLSLQGGATYRFGARK